MRALKAILLVLTVKFVESFYEPHNSSVGESIRKVLLQPCKKFDVFIINSIEDPDENSWIDLIHETTLGWRENCVVQLEDIAHVVKQAKRQSSIIFVDTFQSFLRFYQKFSQENFSFSGFYLIVTKSEFKLEVAKVFKLVWTLMVFNFNVLVYDKSGNISLYTFMPFNDGSCNNTSPVKINEFQSGEWRKNIFFPLKFKNLHECEIRVGTYESAPGLILKVLNNVTSIHGFEGNLFKEIAKQLNFTMDIEVVNYGGGSVFENGSATGLVEKIMQRKFDLIMSLLSSNYLRNIYLTPTKSYYVDKMIVIIPNDRLLDPFLKLFYVFDLRIWMTLFAVFAVSIAIFRVTKVLFPKFSQLFLNEIRTPFLSLITAFVGGSESRTPKKDFPRILFAMFLLFFMVMRSIYIGGLFNILKKEIRVNQINSIDDINRLHYTFYITQAIDVKIRALEIFDR